MISHATKFNLTLHYENFRRRVNESLYVNPPGSIRETDSGQNVFTQRPGKMGIRKLFLKAIISSM